MIKLFNLSWNEIMIAELCSGVWISLRCAPWPSVAVTYRTRRLPVLFVFGKEKIEVRDCERAFRETFPHPQAQQEHVLLMYDTVFSHAVGVFS